MTLFIKCIKMPKRMPKKTIFAQCVGLNIALQLASMLHFLSMAHSIRRPQVCYTFALVLHAKHGLFCFGLFFLLCFCICFWLLLCVWGGGNDANFNNNWSSTSNNKSINNNLFWTIYIERERETHTILKQLYWYCSYPHIFNTCAYVWLYICICGCWYLVHMHFIRKLWPPWEVNYLKKVW